MEKQEKRTQNTGDSVTLCPTKKGGGWKLVHKGIWYYVSKKHFDQMLAGESTLKSGGCIFNKWLPDEERVKSAPRPSRATGEYDFKNEESAAGVLRRHGFVDEAREVQAETARRLAEEALAEPEEV